MHKIVLGDSQWVEMHISLEEDREFPLEIVQFCLGEALGETESREKLPRLVDGKLKVNVSGNTW